MTYAVTVLLAFDIFMNALTGGHPGETISARVQRASDSHHAWHNLWKWPGLVIAKLLVGGLNYLQKRHGVGAEYGDLARARYIVALESSVLDDSLAAARGQPLPKAKS